MMIIPFLHPLELILSWLNDQVALVKVSSKRKTKMVFTHKKDSKPEGRKKLLKNATSLYAGLKYH